MTKKIPKSELQPDPASYRDPQGRLFEWKGELYRGIVASKADFFRNLLSDPSFSDIWRSGQIVETWLCELEIEGYGLVIGHQRVPTRSCPPEWTGSMLKDAALLHLELANELAQRDLSLQDASPWNIQFLHGRPVLVDVTSIRKQAEEDPFLWTAYGQFCNYFLYPLYLFARGHHQIARGSLFNYSRGLDAEVCSRLLTAADKLMLPGALSRLEMPVKLSVFLGSSRRKLGALTEQAAEGVNLEQGRKALFRGLLRDLRKLQPAKAKGIWSDYHQHPEKVILIGDLLEQIKPSSVIDLGCNQGDFAILAARSGARVIALDQEEGCVDELYHKARSENLDILPLVVDLLNPTPPFGWALKECPSLVERLQADCVLCLALLHHLCLGEGQPFERVVTLFAAWSKHHLIIEFVPLNDEKAQELKPAPEVQEWYQEEHLLQVLGVHFAQIKTLESFPSGRKLFVCER